MKFHRTLVQAVIETLQHIFVDGIYADKAVENILKRDSRWGSRDRRFIAETTYEMVRWWRRISMSLPESKDTSIAHYYKLFASWQILKGIELPHWNEFAEIDFDQIKKAMKSLNIIDSRNIYDPENLRAQGFNYVGVGR